MSERPSSSDEHRAYASTRAQSRLREAGIQFQVISPGEISLQGGRPYGQNGRMWHGGMWTFILAPSTPEKPIRTLQRFKDD